MRERAGERLLVVMNFATEPRTPSFPADLPASGQLVLGTDPAREGPEAGPVDLQNLQLRPGEALLIRV